MKFKFSYKFWIFLFIIFNSCTIFAYQAPDINSKSAIVMEAGSGTILYEKNSNTKVYPASITKILTAILAIENLELDQNIVVSETALKIPWDSSTAYLKKDEIVTVEELLHCLLLYSGNDAANVLAEAVSGNISDFILLMNNKAKELGCTGSHFVNAHGYSDDNHYTTALDIAKIFDYCILNEQFVKIISTKLYIVPETNKTNEKRYLYNTNRLILTKEESVHSRFYEYAIGGKTGYTDEAGKTLVTLGKKDGKTLIIAVFKAGTVNGLDARYTDAINLFDYSFDNFNKRTFANSNDYLFDYINYDANIKTKLSITDDIEMLLKDEDEILNVSYKLNLDTSKLDLITKNNYNTTQDVGDIIFIITTNSNSYTASYNLSVLEVTTLNIIKDARFITIIIIFIILIITLTGLIAKLTKKQNKKKKAIHKANIQIKRSRKAARKITNKKRISNKNKH